MINIPILFSTFGIIFLAEIPDKTAFAAFSLGTRNKALFVILGVWLAFLVQTLVAVFAGSLIGLLPTTLVHIAAGVGFIIFAIVTLRRKEKNIEKEEGREISQEKKKHRNIFLTSFLVVFAAEWGDLTQVATATLIAHSKSPLSVAVGAILALWSVTVIAVLVGGKLAKLVPPQKLNIVSAIVFLLVGVVILASALHT